jgi:hypothetical protein
MRGSPTRTHKTKQRKRFHGTPEETPFHRSATRIGNLYDRNPGSRLVKKRAEMWCRLPSLHSWEAPMLNKRPGSIRAASRAADRAEREKRQQAKSKRERKNWLAGDSYTPGTPAQLFARYGARGAMNIVLRENSDAILHQDWAPKFLNPPIKEDEWVPRMHGSPAQWPLKATYVHGSDLRPKPKAVQHDPRYLKTCGRLEEQLGGLKRTIRNDRSKRRDMYRRTAVRVGQRRAQTSRARCTFTGQRPQDAREEAKKLLASDTRELWHRDAKLADSKLRYWKGFTVVELNKEQKNIFMLHKKATRTPGEMKWRELMALCGVMKGSTHRKPGFQDLELLYGALLEKAEQNGSLFTVTRNQFASVVKVRTYGGAREKNLHRLFSAFDADLNDEMDARDFMASMRVLWKPSEPINVKLKSLFSLYAGDDDCLSTKELFTVFLVCTQGSAQEAATCGDVCSAFSLPGRAAAEADPSIRITRDLFEHTIMADRRLLPQFRDQLMERLPRKVRLEIEARGGVVTGQGV